MSEKLPPPSPEEQEQRLERERLIAPDISDECRNCFQRPLWRSCWPFPSFAICSGGLAPRTAYLRWTAIGNMADFPAGETKLIIPQSVHRSMGRRDRGHSCLRAQDGEGSSQYSPSTVPILAVRCGGSPSRSSSCVPVTAEFITRMAAALPGRRSAACSPTSYKVEKLMIDSTSMPGRLPTLSDRA